MNKSHPAPYVPGNTDFERFDNAVHAIMNVPKSVIDKEEAKWKQAQAAKKKKRAKKQG